MPFKDRPQTTDHGQRNEKHSWSVVGGQWSLKRLPPSRDFIWCFLSAILLILSHPPYNFSFLAWIALIPFFFAIEGKPFWQSFRRGYIFGLCYFFGMFWWFVHVTLIGMILLNMYLALYMALFAVTCRFLANSKVEWKIFLTACAWVVWEFIRSRFLSGFGWAALGHTQYQQIWFIQLASLTGIFGISFALVVINQGLYFFIRNWDKRKSMRAVFRHVFIIMAVLFIGVWSYGRISILSGTKETQLKPLRVAVVQPNIAQEKKWDPFQRQTIMGILKRLSTAALQLHPDMIVWPESSLPATPEISPAYLVRVNRFAWEIKTPILLGYVRQQQGAYYNTAGLIGKDGSRLGEYDKLHLVPFGEFIPLRRQLPFLTKVVPIEDLSAGQKPTVFHLKNHNGEYRFSVLICFEDTVSHVARDLVNAGAQMLVNITNDAWFYDTKAPWLHLQAAVFQAVSYHRPLVRSANTGVSASISYLGKIQSILRGDGGKATFRSGVKMFEIDPRFEDTPYLVFGDIFAYLCFACLILNVIIRKNFINISIKGRRRWS